MYSVVTPMLNPSSKVWETKTSRVLWKDFLIWNRVSFVLRLKNYPYLQLKVWLKWHCICLASARAWVQTSTQKRSLFLLVFVDRNLLFLFISEVPFLDFRYSKQVIYRSQFITLSSHCGIQSFPCYNFLILHQVFPSLYQKFLEISINLIQHIFRSHFISDAIAHNEKIFFYQK
jgi:hypothetical protein